MQCLQLTRGEPPATTIAVTITGAGDASYCYATINGTTQYEAGTHEVKAGDTITFGVYGRTSVYYGSVTIDGAEVLKATGASTETYDWTVPSGISTIEIAMQYTSTSALRNGRITVTTA